MWGSADVTEKRAVLMSALAPPKPIISLIRGDDNVGEAEVVLDPRMLSDIQVIDQITKEEVERAMRSPIVA